MDTSSIDTFMVRVRAAKGSNSKDIRLTIDEAFELATVMGQILAQNVSLQNKINTTSVVRIDGGRLA